MEAVPEAMLGEKPAMDVARIKTEVEAQRHEAALVHSRHSDGCGDDVVDLDSSEVPVGGSLAVGLDLDVVDRCIGDVDVEEGPDLVVLPNGEVAAVAGGAELEGDEGDLLVEDQLGGLPDGMVDLAEEPALEGPVGLSDDAVRDRVVVGGPGHLVAARELEEHLGLLLVGEDDGEVGAAWEDQRLGVLDDAGRGGRGDDVPEVVHLLLGGGIAEAREPDPRVIGGAQVEGDGSRGRGGS